MHPRLIACLFAILLCVSCKPKPTVSRPESPAVATPVAAETPAAPSPTPIPVAIDPKTASDVLWVRVAVGALPAQETIAALLSPDTITDETLKEGRVRYALAPLSLWKEEDLLKPSTKIIVFRSGVETKRGISSFALPASLLKIDKETGLGLLAFLDVPRSPYEGGFRLEDKTGAIDSLTALRAVHNSAVPFPSVKPNTPGIGAIFTVEGGKFRKGSGGQLELGMPPDATGTTANRFLVVVGKDGKLAGFLGDGRFTETADFSTAFETSKIEITGASFNIGNTASFEVNLSAAAKDNTPLPPRVLLTVGEVSRAEARRLATPDSTGRYPKVSGTTTQLLTSSKELSARVQEPQGLQQLYALQISAPLIVPSDGNQTVFPPDAPAIPGRPFFIKAERTSKGLVASVFDSQPATAETSPVSSQSPKTGSPSAIGGASSAPETFPLESPARDVHLVAAGREALLALEDAPYWKRFSFENNSWLPLPPMSPNSTMTGNLTALFVLDRKSCEVAKYFLPDLKPAAKIKLPPGEYTAILAGCNSSHAPVHVMGPGNQLALDPDTLQRRDVPKRPPSYVRKDELDRDRRSFYFVSGDGLGIGRASDQYSLARQSYNGDEKGLEWPYLGIERTRAAGVLGVGNGFYLDRVLCTQDNPGGDLQEDPTVAATWDYTPSNLAENCPIIFRLRHPKGRDISQPRLGFFAFSQVQPFVEFDAPELAGATKFLDFQLKRWAFFDPESRKVATLGTDRKNWYVRKIEIPETLEQPVLLNWPDTTLVRGEDFTFRPLLAGGTQFKAALEGGEGGLVESVSSGIVRFPVARDQAESIRLLKIQVPGENDAKIVYPIILHASGPALPFSTLPTVPVEGLNTRGRTLAQLGPGGSPIVPHKAAFYQFPDPIADILGPANDCAILVTANRLDFFSLKERKVVGSCAVSPKASFYPAGGNILEYDADKKILTRISIPRGAREAVFTLPPYANLFGIGAGVIPGSPVVVSGGIVEKVEHITIGGISFQVSQNSLFCLVLDGNTLKPDAKLQPELLEHFLGKSKEEGSSAFRMITAAEGAPSILPTSHDGKMVSLNLGFLTLQPDLALVYPFGNDRALPISQRVYNTAHGSASGLLTVCGGQAYKAGSPTGQWEDYEDYGTSPSGSYRLRKAKAGINELCLDVVLTETNKPLLRLGGLPFLSEISTETGRTFLLGDEGPLAVLSNFGKTLELVDLNIPEAVRKLTPDEVYVISQPAPYIRASQTQNYQVRVNNPDLVDTYRLQRPVRGAALSPDGLLTYQAPSQFNPPMNETISIEILTKQGKTILHEFPIYILPNPAQRPKPPASTPTPTPLDQRSTGRPGFEKDWRKAKQKEQERNRRDLEMQRTQ